jgi:serine phosphatase RsbU (regulator of sigma subunit)
MPQTHPSLQAHADGTTNRKRGYPMSTFADVWRANEYFTTTTSRFNGVEISSVAVAAEHEGGGGDCCEAFAVSPGVLAIIIVDVCGHNAASYVTMTALRCILRRAALQGETPGRALAAANRYLLESEPGTYATAIFALLDVNCLTLVLANAGHPAPLEVSSRGTRLLSFPDADLPLGVDRSSTFNQGAWQILPKSLTVFYSDGITDHERAPIYGAQQLEHAAAIAYARRSEAAAPTIMREMRMRPRLRDDATLLVLRSI